MARQSQLPPDLATKWRVWYVDAGRGFGKTRTGAETVKLLALSRPNMIVGAVAATSADLDTVMFNGPAGLLKVIPHELIKSYSAQPYPELVLYNDSMIQGFSAEKPGRLRGPQFHYGWADELAVWRYKEAWDMFQLCVRLPPARDRNAKIIATTTPKPKPWLIKIKKRSNTVVTGGSTFDNKANLDPETLQEYIDLYEGTRLGRQELYAETLTDVEGALWNLAMLESAYMSKDEIVPEMERVVVAIDPAVSNNENSAETGIVVAGKGKDGKFYIIADLSMKGSPQQWAAEAIRAYTHYKADRIIAEINNGGAMVEAVLRTINPNIPYKAVTATRGKQKRAEPIAALYEQKKVRHTSNMPKLIDQMLTYTPRPEEGDVDVSPDRMDAMVWAMTELSGRRALDLSIT